MSMILTEGQQTAYEAFVKFIAHPSEGAFVIEGYSGTGKTILVETIMQRLSDVLKTTAIKWDIG
jgi:Ni2+-binding GTPase involved in maturation of urease and hydrogenase